MYSGSKRTHNHVGFSPGTSPSAALIKQVADDSNLNDNCCFSSLHDNFYPDNNNSFDSLAYNNNVSPPRMSFVSTKRRKLEPQEEPQDNEQDDLVLFGPIPSMQPFTSCSSVLDPTCSSASFSSSSFIDTTPISFNFDKETVINDDNNSILDDEMIFQELQSITHISNTTSSNNNSFPLSPPMSPSVQHAFDLEQEPDDFILFP